MPVLEGKKVENITAKVNAQQKQLFQEICEIEDRPISYVVRELALRGLSLYMNDKKLKLTEDEEKVFDNRNLEGRQLAPKSKNAIPFDISDAKEKKKVA